ncbi:TRAP transporter substrate-binding protein [Pseudooceanicola aestuarii]|uniref:TRAP transporter substrate-binding protein n=1 Tax=Pseudooceanicola aestuarii TaxID=2697319 RepID=UPI0013CF7C03|nr:TRAP transporter substrate-binding protein [Pseudooceanicola aestuarii]
MYFKKLGGIALGTALAISATTAQAKELAFAVFIPASSPTIQQVYQPWVDWFNEQVADDDVSIKMFAGGTLGRNPFTQADLVANGVADMTLTVPSYTPGVYPDFDIFELPGLARTTAEGSQAVLELYEEGKLRGYQDYHVVALYTSGGYMLHTKEPLADFAAIKDRKLRVAGQIQTAVVDALGGVPQNMSALEMAENIDRGLIDGAVADASVAKTFRVADVAPHHYDAEMGVLVFAIILNKDVYEELPDSAKTALAESRQFIVDRQVASYTAAIEANMTAWTEDPDHNVVIPDAADRARITEAVQPVVDQVGAAASDGLLDAYRAKLDDIRSR